MTLKSIGLKTIMMTTNKVESKYCIIMSLKTFIYTKVKP